MIMWACDKCGKMIEGVSYTIRAFPNAAGDKGARPKLSDVCVPCVQKIFEVFSPVPTAPTAPLK